MERTKPLEKSLAQAVTKIVDSLHHIYKGIQIKPIPPYEDEDFTIEVKIPGTLSKEEVLDRCHAECIKAEDEFDVFILPKVVYE